MLAEAPWRNAIGKMLLAGALQRNGWPGVPWRRGWRHCGEDPSGRCCWPETLHGRECGSIGKQLRVYAETPDAGRPVEKRQCRYANAATPVQKRRCRNADSETPMQKRQCSNAPWNATAQKQCAALGLMCPTLRKKLSKRASELASKLPSMQPASELAS